MPGLNENTKLLLHADGQLDGAEIIESSSQIGTYKFNGKGTNGGSAYFNGYDSRIEFPASADWQIHASNSENWTVDFWVKLTGEDHHDMYILTQHDTTDERFYLAHFESSLGNDRWGFSFRTSATWYIVNTPPGTGIPRGDNDWHHICVVKILDEYGIYQDGQQIGYAQHTGITATYDAPLDIGWNNAGGAGTGWLNGFIDELRIQNSNPFGAVPVIGASDEIDVPTAQHTPDSNTKLLLHFDGDLIAATQQHTATTSGDTGTMFDRHPGHVTTLNGTATIVPNNHVFGVSGLHLNNTNWISVPDSTDWDIFGTNSDIYTIDFWIKLRNPGVAEEGCIAHQADNSNRWWIGGNGALFITYRTGGIQYAQAIARAFPILDEEWHHVMCLVEGTGAIKEYSIYIDGVQGGWASEAVNSSYTAPLSIGSRGVTAFVDGDMDEVRIQNSNYFNATPTTIAPYLQFTMNENAANTTVDNSGLIGPSGDGATVGGNTDTFATTGKIGGAFYFDASSKSINADGTVGIASDTTGVIMGWVNPDVVNIQQSIFSVSNATSATDFSDLRLTNGGNVLFVAQDNGVNQLLITSVGTITASVWTHIAVVQDGVSAKIYINGALDGATPSTGSTQWLSSVTTSAADTVRVGALNFNSGGDQFHFDGKMDDFRYYQNTSLSLAQIQAIYNSGSGNEGLGDLITVPTSAGVADTDTKLLMHFDGNLVDSSDNHVPVSVGGAGAACPPVGGRGSYISTDTTSYVSMPDVGGDWDWYTDTDESWTIDFWVRSDVLGTTHNYVGSHDGSNQWGINKDTNDNVNVFINNPGTVVSIGTHTNSIPDLDWHHIALVKVGGTPTYGIYIDGGQAAHSTDPDGGSAISAALHVGAKNAVSGVVGKMSDFRISKSNAFGVTPSATQANAHFKLNENAANTTVYDFGSGANDGTASGNTNTFASSGKINTAFDFDGSSQINIDGVANAYKTNSQGTVAAWVNTDTLSGAGEIFTFGDTNADNYFSIYRSGSALYVSINGSTGDGSKFINSIFSVGTWVHIAITQNTTAMKFYINGVDTAYSTTGTDRTTAWVNADSLGTLIDNGRIGSLNFNSGGEQFRFDGRIDDVRYYNIALTETQVGYLYNSGLGQEESSLSPVLTVPTTKHTTDSRTTVLLPMDTHDYSGDGENG
jgi:hypothetical protein